MQVKDLQLQVTSLHVQVEVLHLRVASLQLRVEVLRLRVASLQLQVASVRRLTDIRPLKRALKNRWTRDPSPDLSGLGYIKSPLDEQI